ncbi:MAG: class I SAM-dependent methyltransferase [Candidatus Obscuribacterales bacterium]|nr:class I SAM-dependent methyltransferase [Candidatus Obscuribacterales bacterium]
MDLKQLEQNWNEFGRRDPFWAILSFPGKEGNKWNRDEFFRTGRDEIDKALEFVGQQGLRINYGSALDFGCGAGRLTQALAQRFEKTYGVDIAESMIKLAKEYNQYPESCFYEVNRQPNLSQFVDGQFNFIYSCRVLQHMKPEYALNYVREFIRILAPGGVIVFQEPTEKLPGQNTQILEAPKGIKAIVKSLIPRPLLNWYFKTRMGYLCKQQQQTPQMEMYGIPVEEMKRFVESHGAIVKAVVPDDSCDDWRSYCYCITNDNGNS